MSLIDYGLLFILAVAVFFAIRSLCRHSGGCGGCENCGNSEGCGGREIYGDSGDCDCGNCEDGGDCDCGGDCGGDSGD